jgi:hypothetical protein
VKALIKKRGNERGRYYQGRTIKEIVRKFLQSKPSLFLVRLEELKSQYEIFTVDTKTDKWVFYVIPKNKIIK